MKKGMTLLLAMAMLVGLCACSRGQDEHPTDPETTTASPIETVTGKFYLYFLRSDNEELNLALLKQLQMADSFIHFHEDTTALLSITGEEQVTLTYDAENNRLNSGEHLLFCVVDGEIATITYPEDGTVMKFAKEGSDLLKENTSATPPGQMEAKDESLSYLRDLMMGTNLKMAVAYLGRLEMGEDLQSMLAEKCPELLQKYSFIGQITQDKIIGQVGEVYCILPAASDYMITVNLIQDSSGEPGDILYQGASGDPILLLCNSGDDPDTQVNIVDGWGVRTIWTPGVDRYGTVAYPQNREAMLDFTNYFELYPDYKQAMLAQGWRLTDEAYLTRTCWTYYEDAPEDRCWLLNINGDTVQLELLVDGVTVETQHCEGTWALNYSDDDGLTYLFVNMLRADGEPIAGEYVVLQCPNEPGILLGIQEGQEQLPVPCEEDVSFWWGSVG